jgi:hypothetical protein
VTPKTLYSLLGTVAIIGTTTVVLRQSPSAPVTSTPAPRGQAAPEALRDGVVADVDLDRLQRAPRGAANASRDPFRFRPRAAPPVRSTRNAAPVSIAPVPAGPPPLPPIPLRFIGLIEPVQRSGRVAMLSDGRGAVISGREGDIIEGRYRVLRIGADSLELAYADGRGRQTIRLSGQ